MKATRPQLAKILNHDAGLGVPDPDLVRQRAHELAEIDGRKEINASDWLHARQELHGGHPDDSENDDGMAQSSSLGEPAVRSLGHHTPNMLFNDDDHAVEELIAEGLDEADHEQRLAASRSIRPEDDGAGESA